MESDGGSLLEMISGALFRKHAVEAIFASTATVLFYDWLLLLPQEVEYIWCAPWKWTKVLYLLTRYIPFASMSFMLLSQFAWNATPALCKMTLRVTCWLSVVGMDFAEIVLAARTYAVWNRDKRVGIGLALLLGLCQIPNAIIAEKFIRTITFIRNPYPEIIRGCVAITATKLIFVNWVIFMVLEGVVLALMVISALKTYNRYKSNFMKVIYMDGIRFYLYLFCVTLVNIFITVFLPIEFISVGSCLVIVSHSILACRLMIGMREASQSSASKSDTLEFLEVTGNNTVQLTRESA